jgi:hypothetical protein
MAPAHVVKPATNGQALSVARASPPARTDDLNALLGRPELLLGPAPGV